jgi:dTDP-4-amino-4,6-dideoxygalactose transaminase
MMQDDVLEEPLPIVSGPEWGVPEGAGLGVKLKYLQNWIEKRRRVARYYGELLAEMPGLILPIEAEGREHAWHVYGVRVAPHSRTSIMEFLREKGIGTGLHYPVPAHLKPCFAHLGYSSGQFPHSELQAISELSLPIYPEMRMEQVRYVAENLRYAVGIHASDSPGPDGINR